MGHFLKAQPSRRLLRENDLINTCCIKTQDRCSLFYVRSVSGTGWSCHGGEKEFIRSDAHFHAFRVSQPSVSRDSLPFLGHPLFQTVASIPGRRTRVRFARSPALLLSARFSNATQHELIHTANDNNQDQLIHITLHSCSCDHLNWPWSKTQSKTTMEISWFNTSAKFLPMYFLTLN